MTDLRALLANAPGRTEWAEIAASVMDELVAVAEAARPFVDPHGFVATLDDYSALRAALTALDARLAEENK